MKNIYFNILISFIVIVVSLIGCKDMEDTYHEFVADGEKIYIGKADSIIVRGGENRAEISWLLISDPKVSSYKIYWNSRQDSVENSVIKTDNVDTVRVLLDNISEGTHHFEIITYDKYGNSSVPAQANGVVYGSKYQSSLLNRTYLNFERDKKNLVINWMPAETTLAGVELEYVDIDGKTVTRMIPAIIETYSLPNFPVDGSFRYRSLFLPDPFAVDTFKTSYVVTDVDDKKLTGRLLTFNTETRYGAQEDLISIFVSNDFDGVYEVENVEAATWVDVTDIYPLPTVDRVVTTMGPYDLSEFTAMGESTYLAIRYHYDPDKGAGKTWIFTALAVTNLDNVILMNFADVQFTQVFKGPAPYEDGRSYVVASAMHFRPYNQTTDLPYTVWGITKPLN